MTIPLVLGGFAALTCLVFWLDRRSRRQAVPVFFHTNCPACRQRLRFPERQAGQPAACPRCKKLYVLPAKAALQAAG
jgi:uncharacterized paraquat-inducible protein A